MIKKLSYILVDNNIIDEDDTEIYEYGIFVILFNLLCIGSIILLGALFNKFHFTLEFLLFYLPNRMIIGGYHCDTAKKCYAVFISTYAFILLCSYIIPYNNMFYHVGIIMYIILLYLHWKNSKHLYYFLFIVFLCFLYITLILNSYKDAFFYATVLNFILYFLQNKSFMKKICCL